MRRARAGERSRQPPGAVHRSVFTQLWLPPPRQRPAALGDGAQQRDNCPGRELGQARGIARSGGSAISSSMSEKLSEGREFYWRSARLYGFRHARRAEGRLAQTGLLKTLALLLAASGVFIGVRLSQD